MAGIKDVTLLFAVEARENATAIIDKITGSLDRWREHMERIAGVTRDMSGQMDATYGDIESMQAIATASSARLEAANAELAASFDAVKRSTAEFAAGADGAYEKMQADAARVVAAQREVLAATDASKVANERLTISEEAAGVKAEESAGKQELLSGAFNKVGVGALATVAGLAVLSKATIDSSVQYQTATNSIANSANISTKAAQSIGNAFLTTAGQSTFSAQDMATSYGKVAGQLGLVQGHALNSKQALDFMNVATEAAEASGSSLAATTTNLAKIMQSFHMNTGQAAQAASVLYNASRVTGVQFNQLTNQLTRMKSQLGVLAPSIGDTSTFMVDLVQHGVQGRQAMMMMNTVMTQLTKTAAQATPTTQEVAKAFGSLPAAIQPLAQAYENGSVSQKAFANDLKGMSPPMKAYMGQFKALVDKSQESEATLNALKLTPVQEQLAQLGVKVFNNTGNFVGMGSVIAQLAPKIDKLHGTQAKLAALQPIFGGNTKKMLGVIEGGSKDWERYNKTIMDANAMHAAAKRNSESFEGSMRKLRATLSDVKIVIGNALMPIVMSLMHVVMGILGPIMTFIMHNQTLVKVILAVVAAIALTISAIFLVNKAINTVKDTFKALQLIMMENPWMLIALAIVGLVLGLIELYKHFKIVRDIVADVGKFFKDTFKIIVDAAKEAFDWIKKNWPLLIEILAGPIGWVVAIWTHFHKQITDVVMGIIDWIKTNWPLIIEILTGPIGWIIALWTHFHTQIIDIFKKIWSFIKGIWDGMVSYVSNVLDTIVSYFVALPGRFVSGLGNIIETVWGIMKSSGQWIDNNVLKPIVNYFVSLPGRFVSGLGNIIATVWGVLKGSATWIDNNVLQPVISFFTGLPGRIVNALGNAASLLWQWGKDLIQGMINGITSLVGNVGSAFKSVFDSIPGVSLLKKIPGLSWLAEGGLVTKPTLSVVGEAGPEMVIPLSKLGSMMPPVQPLGSAIPAASGVLRASGGGGNVVLNVNFTGQVYGSLDEFAKKLGNQLATNTLPHGGVVLS